jgi:polysaccharide chain length determinant protein (PEP-CTERM system associated)
MAHPATRTSSPSIPLSQLVLLWRRHARWICIASFLLATVGVSVVALLPNVYRATTTILVDPQKIPEKYVSSTVTTDPNGRLNTLTQEVLSSSRLQEVVDQHALYPEMRRTHSHEEVLDYMREKTKIVLKQGPDSEPGLSSFSISYEDHDPALAANVANALAANFINWNLKARQQAAAGTTGFLTAEAARAKQSLENQERQLQAFRLAHAGATPDELTTNLQILARLHTELEANADTLNRLEQERILTVHTATTSVTAQPVTERQRLMQEKRRLEGEQWLLKKQFTEVYPDRIANDQALHAIDAQLAALPKTAESNEEADVRLTLLDSQIKRRRQQGDQINEQIHNYQAKVNSVPVLQTQLVELTRNYEASRENYQSLLDKTFSAGMAEELERNQQAERFTILDPARKPGKPIWPARIPVTAGVIVFSGVLPLAFVYGKFVLTGRVISPLEVREMLPRGTVPFISVPVITTEPEARRLRLRASKAIVVSLLVCTTIVLLLMKVRPIL